MPFSSMFEREGVSGASGQETDWSSVEGGRGEGDRDEELRKGPSVGFRLEYTIGAY